MDKNIKLHPYEQEIEDSLERGEWQPVENPEEMKTMLKEAAHTTMTKLKSKNINLRLMPTDVAAIKAKASKKGLPYQTLISCLIHQYATDQIDLNL